MMSAKISRDAMDGTSVARLELWTALGREPRKNPYKQTRRQIATALRRHLRAAQVARSAS